MGICHRPVGWCILLLPGPMSSMLWPAPSWLCDGSGGTHASLNHLGGADSVCVVIAFLSADVRVVGVGWLLSSTMGRSSQ